MAWGGSSSGQFHGAWFGAQGEADPNALNAGLSGAGALSATATAIGWLSASLSGSGDVDSSISSHSAVGLVGGGGWLPKMRRKSRKELHAERVKLGILPPDVVKAAKKAAAVVLDEPSPVKAYRADPEAANKVFLQELGATKMLPDYRRAIQIQIEIMQQEDDEMLLFF